MTNIVIKGNIRAYFSDYTKIAQTAIDKHKAKPLGALALATAITTFAPLGFMKKEGKITFIVNGDGPLKTIIVETKANGDTRASISNPQVITDEDNKNFNSIPISLGIGHTGFLKVINEYNGKVFEGEVKLVKGDIVTDLAYYFNQSEQINSAVLSSVILSTPKKLKQAYGVILQLMPNHIEKDIKYIEKFLKENSLKELGIKELERKFGGNKIDSIQSQWKCNCTKRKMESLLDLLNKEEKKELIKKRGRLEVTCNFCRTVYSSK